MRTDDRVFVQNEITACVHVARSWDQNLTTFGWQYATAKRVNGAGYRILNTLVNLPGSMLCERCLTTERAVALGAHAAELSGDENYYVGKAAPVISPGPPVGRNTGCIR